VRVIHQQVQPVPDETSADLVAISFFTGFAPEAYRIARHFKKQGKTVVLGGPHVTFSPEEALAYCDAVVIGEAESVWENLLSDAERGVLERCYIGRPGDLNSIPTPRYDLLETSFVIPRVIQATRGCRFTCSFCSVPVINPGYRTRPIEAVLRDVEYKAFPHWWQRKVAWFWDDNLTIDRRYAKDLLRSMIPLHKWWLTQASMDIAKDPELLELMGASGCIGVFLGIESFGIEALKEANKLQNKIQNYKDCVKTLHQYGIAVMAGFIAGFDGDTTESIVAMSDRLMEIGVDVPFLSILTPYKGTPLYDRLAEENRIIEERGWEFYNGYNVAFQPEGMPPDQLLAAHRRLWKRTFSLPNVMKRLVRPIPALHPGSYLLTLAMNSFYGLKAWRGNTPLDMSSLDAKRRGIITQDKFQDENQGEIQDERPDDILVESPYVKTPHQRTRHSPGGHPGHL
jgi:radical SAM superfamily enzyme YgiQ (UPF0313 family)